MTLGCKEVEDVEVVVNHLRSTGKVSTIALWGRSMGAVTALLYSQWDPSVAGIVRRTSGGGGMLGCEGALRRQKAL